MAPVCIDMHDPVIQSRSTYSAHPNTEQRTLGGLVVYLLAIPALVAVVAAPAVAVGAAMCVAGLVLGRRVVRHLRRQQAGSSLSSVEGESGQPA